MSNHDPRHGLRVQCEAKHLSGKTGVITKLDRGNVWVKLDNGETVCTRWAKLTELKDDPYNDPEYG